MIIHVANTKEARFEDEITADEAPDEVGEKQRRSESVEVQHQNAPAESNAKAFDLAEADGFR